MATGGAGPEEAGQGGPVVMKKMVPVQSSRTPAAASGPLVQQGEMDRSSHLKQYWSISDVILCNHWNPWMFFAGSVTGDGGLYSSGATGPEQRVAYRQPAAHSAPPARQQPPPAEEEEEANDYDSDEASK